MTTPTRTPKLLVATFLAATVVLSATACNDDKTSPPATQSTPAPTTPPTTPATTTPTRPATPPPTIPAAATKGLTVTSAEAFARFYLTATDYLLATGDAGVMRQWADKGCIGCETIAKRYSQMYRDGGSVTGEFRVKIEAVREVKLIRQDTAAVVFRAREGRQVERSKAGAKPVVLPGGPYTWDLTLAASGSHWTMFEMEQKP